jgi:hypothetical protein
MKKEEEDYKILLGHQIQDQKDVLKSLDDDLQYKKAQIEALKKKILATQIDNAMLSILQ